jgi:hypothetical protein
VLVGVKFESPARDAMGWIGSGIKQESKFQDVWSATTDAGGDTVKTFW